MKRIPLLFSLTFSCLFFLCSYAQAQDSYVPTDKWPYIFESFSNGTISFFLGGGSLTADMNICVSDGTIHYVKDGVILANSNNNIESISLNGAKFIPVSGAVMEVLYDDDNGQILKERFVEEDGDGVDIGYGITTSTVAAQNLDLTASAGLGLALVHSKIAEAVIERDYGVNLKIGTKYYVRTANTMMPATKKDFQNTVGKDVSSSFLKANKVKWDETASLVKVLECLAENLK